MFTLKIKKSYTLTYNRHRCLSGLFQHPRKSELSFLSMNAQVYSQHSPVQCFSDLGAFRTTVEVLPLLLDMKTASWSQCARVAVCVCVVVVACMQWPTCTSSPSRYTVGLPRCIVPQIWLRSSILSPPQQQLQHLLLIVCSGCLRTRLQVFSSAHPAIKV